MRIPVVEMYFFAETQAISELMPAFGNCRHDMLFGLVLVTAISAAPLDARPKSLLFAAKATVPTSHAAHASHYADLQAAATTRSAVVAHKLTLMVDHKEVASKQVNGRTDIASSYQAKYAEVTARLDAQKKLCEDCKIAEDELITALQTATEKHTTAQGKSEAHVAAVSAHTAAEVQWNDKHLEFLAKKGDMTCSALTVNSADSAFEACVSIVGELKVLAGAFLALPSHLPASQFSSLSPQVLAGEETSLEAYMTTKKGVMDTAKAEYDAVLVLHTDCRQAFPQLTFSRTSSQVRRRRGRGDDRRPGGDHHAGRARDGVYRSAARPCPDPRLIH